jgi:hypothetical protein
VKQLWSAVGLFGLVLCAIRAVPTVWASLGWPYGLMTGFAFLLALVAYICDSLGYRMSACEAQE